MTLIGWRVKQQNAERSEGMMKSSHSSWGRILILMLGAVLALLVVGAALLVGFLLGRTPDFSIEPTLTVWPTSNAGLAAPSVAPPSRQTPSDTAPTDTPRPTLEPQPAASSTPQSASTPTRKPTNTPSPTPVQSPTPPIRIRTFTASPDPIERGGTVTLNWDAPGAKDVGITRLSPEGDILLATEAFDLPARGSIDLQVPENYVVSVKYVLGARDANGELANAYAKVGVICSYDEHIAPRCPLTQDEVWAAYEPFEHGHMIWRSDTREIYVLYDDAGYETYHRHLAGR